MRVSGQLFEWERENYFTVFFESYCTALHCWVSRVVALTVQLYCCWFVKFFAGYCFDYFTALRCWVKILLKHFMWNHGWTLLVKFFSKISLVITAQVVLQMVFVKRNCMDCWTSPRFCSCFLKFDLNFRYFFSKNDVLKHEAFSLSFHFVCILKRKCKATFSLSLHFVCSLKRKCKGCLFTLNQNCKASFALSFHFVCSFHFLFTFFSLLMQSAKMLFSLLSNCNQSEKKVKRQPLHTFLSNCKQSEKKVQTPPLWKNVFSCQKRFLLTFQYFFKK